MAIANPTQEAVAYPAPDVDRYGDWARLLQEGNFDAFTRSLIEWNRQLAESLALVMQGKINNTGGVTLPSGSTQLTVVDPRIGSRTQIYLVATDTPARQGGGYHQTLPNAVNGQAVIHYVADQSNDRNFAYFLIG